MIAQLFASHFSALLRVLPSQLSAGVRYRVWDRGAGAGAGFGQVWGVMQGQHVGFGVRYKGRMWRWDVGCRGGTSLMLPASVGFSPAGETADTSLQGL